MKKLLQIAIPLLVVASLVAILLTLDSHKIPAWQIELSLYQKYQNVVANQSLVLLAATPASQPQNFTPEMSQATFSDSGIFHTDLSPDASPSLGVQPLPYPPQAVECVFLLHGGIHDLVFIALYSDLYNADWVVHISSNAWGSATLQSTLDQLGCNPPK